MDWKKTIATASLVAFLGAASPVLAATAPAGNTTPTPAATVKVVKTTKPTATVKVVKTTKHVKVVKHVKPKAKKKIKAVKKTQKPVTVVKTNTTKK